MDETKNEKEGKSKESKYIFIVFYKQSKYKYILLIRADRI